MQLFVARCSTATAEEVSCAFAVCGEVEEVHLFPPWPTATASKGSGLVVMATAEGAANAVANLHGNLVWEGSEGPMVVERYDPLRVGVAAASAAAAAAAVKVESAAAFADTAAARLGLANAARQGWALAAARAGGMDPSAPFGPASCAGQLQLHLSQRLPQLWQQPRGSEQVILLPTVPGTPPSQHTYSAPLFPLNVDAVAADHTISAPLTLLRYAPGSCSGARQAVSAGAPLCTIGSGDDEVLVLPAPAQTLEMDEAMRGAMHAAAQAQAQAMQAQSLSPLPLVQLDMQGLPQQVRCTCTVVGASWGASSLAMQRVHACFTAHAHDM